MEQIDPERLDRRDFLNKAGAAGATVILVTIGMHRKAEAALKDPTENEYDEIELGTLKFDDDDTEFLNNIFDP